MGRNDFTNPAVFKAETELRQVLASYESYIALYKVNCAIATNTINNGLKLSQNLKKTMQECSEEIDKLEDEYNKKLEIYKSIIGF